MPLFRKQSAAGLPSLAPHDSKARLLSGRDSQGFMAKPCTPHLITRKGYATSVRQQSCQRLCNPQRVQSFKLQTRKCRGSRGTPLAFSWGSKGAILSRERMAPFPVQRQRRCFFPETFLSVSEKRFQLLCAVISEKRIKRRIHRAAAKVAVNAHMLDALVEADISCAVAGRGVVGCTQCFGGFQLVVRAIV